jgi:hydrogenase maturation protease
LKDRNDTTRCQTSLVIGYGNPLRGDDGVGWHVAATLEARREDLTVEVITCQQLVPELAERISLAKNVYFVDANRAGVPGEWRCEPIRVENAAHALAHFASPSALLAMAQKLFGAAPTAHLFTVCGASFELGEELSAVVAAAIPSVAAAIVSHVMAAEIKSGSPKLEGQNAATRNTVRF